MEVAELESELCEVVATTRVPVTGNAGVGGTAAAAAPVSPKNVVPGILTGGLPFTLCWQLLTPFTVEQPDAEAPGPLVKVVT